MSTPIIRRVKVVDAAIIGAAAIAVAVALVSYLLDLTDNNRPIITTEQSLAQVSGECRDYMAGQPALAVTTAAGQLVANPQDQHARDTMNAHATCSALATGQRVFGFSPTVDQCHQIGATLTGTDDQRRENLLNALNC